MVRSGSVVVFAFVGVACSSSASPPPSIPPATPTVSTASAPTIPSTQAAPPAAPAPPAPAAPPADATPPPPAGLALDPIPLQVRPRYVIPAHVALDDDALVPYRAPITGVLVKHRPSQTRAAILAKRRLAAIATLQQLERESERERVRFRERARPATEAELRVFHARRARFTKVNHERSAVQGELHDLLVQQAAQLTIDGVVLRAEIQLALASPVAVDPADPWRERRVDTSAAARTLDNLFAREPSAAKHGEASYLRVLLMMHDDARAGADSMLAFAKANPRFRLVEEAYVHAGRVLFADALAGEGNAAEVDAALDVFEWLGKRARTVERRRIAQFRAGQLIAHQGSQPLAVEQMCKLVDDRGTPEGLRRYASTYIERGLARMDKPFDQVADECARRKCPCTYPLVASLAAYAKATDDSTTTLLLLPTALEKFPLEPLAATWACSVVQAEEARGGKDAVTDRARYEQTYGVGARSAWKRKFPTADTQCKPPVPATTLDEIRRSLTRTVAACLAHRADPEPDETGVEIAFTVELNAAGRVTDSDAKYADRAASECIQRKLWDARWSADARSPITGTFEVTWSR